MSYEKCREILIKECELIQNAQTAQGKLRQAVTNREWTDFEVNFKAINTIEEQLEVLEKEREAVLDSFVASCNEVSNAYGQMTGTGMKDSKGRFYAMACLLPQEQRNELTAIYRGLKLESLKLRLANDDFMNYLAGIKATLTEFFSLAFPDRGGKMYTPTGTHFSHDMRSMVLNHRF